MVNHSIIFIYIYTANLAITSRYYNIVFYISSLTSNIPGQQNKDYITNWLQNLNFVV